MNKKQSIWLGIGSLLAAAVAFVWVKNRNKNGDDEKPPKDAPQLNIQNPGDQSEFPSSPTDPELG